MPFGSLFRAIGALFHRLSFQGVSVSACSSEFRRELVRHRLSNRSAYFADRRIAIVIANVESDLGRRWTASEMAELVRLSPSRFAHLFVTVAGVSPARFLSEARLIEAHHLLDSTLLTIKEVAVR